MTLELKAFYFGSPLENYFPEQSFLDGKIQSIPATHGYGWVRRVAGYVMGFHLALVEEKSVYISSDTIYTEAVDKALKEKEPDIVIFAAGKAQLDIGQPLLMHEADMVQFVKNAPNQVLANHMEALNHCPFTRTDLKSLLAKHQLAEKVAIPEDGALVEF